MNICRIASLVLFSPIIIAGLIVLLACCLIVYAISGKWLFREALEEFK